MISSNTDSLHPLEIQVLAGKGFPAADRPGTCATDSTGGFPNQHGRGMAAHEAIGGVSL